jgi:hypothetical protein
MLSQLRNDLDTVQNSGGAYLKKTLTVAYTDLTVDTTDGTQSFNLGTALPAGAVPVGAQVNLATSYVGNAAPSVDIGIAGGHEIAQTFNAAGTTGKYAKYPAAAKYSGAQLTALFTPASGHKLMSQSSAGSVTIDVFYFIAF